MLYMDSHSYRFSLLGPHQRRVNKFLPSIKIGIPLGFAELATCIVFIPKSECLIFPDLAYSCVNQRLSDAIDPKYIAFNW